MTSQTWPAGLLLQCPVSLTRMEGQKGNQDTIRTETLESTLSPSQAKALLFFQSLLGNTEAPGSA